MFEFKLGPKPSFGATVTDSGGSGVDPASIELGKSRDFALDGHTSAHIIRAGALTQVPPWRS